MSGEHRFRPSVENEQYREGSMLEQREILGHQIYSVELKGHRERQEDAHVVREIQIGNQSVGTVVVADGHGRAGAEASGYAVSRILQLLQQREAFPDREAFVEDFDTIDREIAQVHENGGSTLSVALIEQSGIITVAHVGDSEVRLITKDGKIPTIALPHTLKNRKEKQRLYTRYGDDIGHGKRLLSDDGTASLALTRSLGNRAFSTVEHRPDIHSFRPQEHDRYLLIASDGLWEKTFQKKKRSELVHMVLDADNGASATRAIHAFLASKDIENTTCVLVDLQSS